MESQPAQGSASIDATRFKYESDWQLQSWLEFANKTRESIGVSTRSREALLTLVSSFIEMASEYYRVGINFLETKGLCNIPYERNELVETLGERVFLAAQWAKTAKRLRLATGSIHFDLRRE